MTNTFNRGVFLAAETIDTWRLITATFSDLGITQSTFPTNVAGTGERCDAIVATTVEARIGCAFIDVDVTKISFPTSITDADRSVSAVPTATINTRIGLEASSVSIVRTIKIAYARVGIADR